MATPVGITELYAAFLDSKGVCTDTRKIFADCLFIALKGPNFDANTFAKKAIEQGAKHAIIDDPSLAQESGMLYVEDGLVALQNLARYHRQQLQIPIVAITGSNGKTTTKELVHRVLATKYNCFSTQGNLNNHIGVPLSLLSLTPDVEIAIIEMGANHLYEIDLLCDIAQPTVGLVTNVGMDHLEGYGSLENVAKGNAELYTYLGKTKGTIFLNALDTTLKPWAEASGAEILTYMTPESNTFTSLEESALMVKVKTTAGTTIQTQLIGAYNWPNITVALAIGAFFGVDEKSAGEAISAYIPTNNRSQLVKLGNHTIILDAYNANPSSVEAALRNFAQMDLPNKVVALGDMLELGDFSFQEHQRMAKLTKDLGFSTVLFCGKEFLEHTSHFPDFHFFATTTEAVEWIRTQSWEPISLLVKGSRGIGMEKILKAWEA